MRWVTELLECSCSGLTEGDELLTRHPSGSTSSTRARPTEEAVTTTTPTDGHDWGMTSGSFSTAAVV